MKPLMNDRREIFMNLFYPERFVNLDIDKWVEEYARRGATSFCIDVKDQAYVYYDSKFAQKWPLLGKRDLTREFAEAVRRRGLKWSAYIAPNEFESLNLDDKHTDWQFHFEDGSTSPGRFWDRAHYCWNSPYMDLFLNLLKEITEKYHPDGFYLDGVAFQWYLDRPLCYCKYCREKFRREYAMELPSAKEPLSEAFTNLILARRKWNAEVTAKIRQVIDSIDPRVTIVANCVFGFHGWTCSMRPAAAKNFDLMCAENAPDELRSEVHPKEFSQVDTFFWKAFLLRKLVSGRQCEFFSSYSGRIPAEELKLNVDLYSAAGMRSSLATHRQDVTGLFARIREIEPYLIDLSPAPEVVMLFSENTHIGGFRSQGTMPEIPDISNDPFFSEPQIFFKMALDTHTPLEMISDDDMDERKLHGAGTLILPSVMVLSEQSKNNLRTMINDGMNLLATMNCGTKDVYGKTLTDELLFPGSGLIAGNMIKTAKVNYFHHDNGTLIFKNPVAAGNPKYLSFAEGSVKDWMGREMYEDVKTACRPLEDRQADCMKADPKSIYFPFETMEIIASEEWKVLANLKYLDASDNQWKSVPAILERSLGKGKIIMLAFRLAVGQKTALDMIRHLILTLFSRLNVKRDIDIQASPCVKSCFFRNPQGRVIHLVNTLSGQTDTLYAEERIPVPVRIRIHNTSPEKITSGGESPEITAEGNDVLLSWSGMKGHAAIGIAE